VLSPPPRVRVHLATEPVSFHKSHDGLCGIVRNHLDGEPLADVWVFYNRRRTDLKILWFDHGGFVVAHKKLARGCFRIPKVSGREVALTGAELAALLEGIDLTRARRLPRWNPPPT
jgi:transposase